MENYDDSFKECDNVKDDSLHSLKSCMAELLGIFFICMGILLLFFTLIEILNGDIGGTLMCLAISVISFVLAWPLAFKKSKRNLKDFLEIVLSDIFK